MTVIELLTVFAVVSLLIALLFPAVQLARETARRASCANNLKQQALALQMYHQTERSLPYGAYGGWGFDWRTHLLPYLEQQSLADRIPAGESGYWGGKDRNSQALQLLARTSLTFNRCPTHMAAIHEQRSINALAGRAISSYSGNAGSDVVVDTSSDGRIDMRRGNGALKAVNMKAPGSYGVHFARITDGLSRTILIGEVTYQVDEQCGICDRFALYHPNFDNLTGNDFSEALATTRLPMNTKKSPVLQELAFASDHGRGVQVAFVDGSIHFVNSSIAFNVWQALGSIDQAD